MFSKQRFSKRKAISPIIATVLIIAVTLIAAVAIGGFVFGIFGSSSNSSEVQVTSIALTAALINAGSGTTSCQTGSIANSLGLSNTGTSAASVTAATITYGGSVYTWNLVSLGCSVTPAGETGSLSVGNPLYLTLSGAASPAFPGGASSGASYTGTVTMSNGAILIFAGTFI